MVNWGYYRYKNRMAKKEFQEKNYTKLERLNNAPLIMKKPIMESIVNIIVKVAIKVFCEELCLILYLWTWTVMKSAKI